MNPAVWHWPQFTIAAFLTVMLIAAVGSEHYGPRLRVANFLTWVAVAGIIYCGGFWK